jgi:TRAP-type transport system periplasmic protein
MAYKILNSLFFSTHDAPCVTPHAALEWRKRAGTSMKTHQLGTDLRTPWAGSDRIDARVDGETADSADASGLAGSKSAADRRPISAFKASSISLDVGRNSFPILAHRKGPARHADRHSTGWQTKGGPKAAHHRLIDRTARRLPPYLHEWRVTMKIERTVIASGISLAFLMAGSTAHAQQAVNVSYNVAEGSSWHQGAERFRDLVAEYSDDAYEVRLHPNASLAGGSDRVEMEMTQSGAIHFLIKSTTWMTGLDDRYQALGLPWLFPDHETANAVLDGPAGDELMQDLDQHDLVGLAWGVNGFRQVTNSRGPITEPDDLDGLSVRVPGIELYLDIFEELGASPTTMNFSEVFTALQTGAVDAQENPLSLIWSSRFYDVQDHVTMWNYSYDALAFVGSGPFWQELSEEDQEMFQRAAQEAMDFQREVVAQEDVDLVGELEEQGMTVTTLSDDELTVFQDALVPVYDSYKDSLGADFVNLFEEGVEDNQ